MLQKEQNGVNAMAEAVLFAYPGKAMVTFIKQDFEKMSCLS